MNQLVSHWQSSTVVTLEHSLLAGSTLERTSPVFSHVLAESRRCRSSRHVHFIYQPSQQPSPPTQSWVPIITTYSVSVGMPRTRTSKRHTRKWYILIFYLAHHPDLTSPNSQALKWHPDRNAGSEEASQKFKQVSRLLISTLLITSYPSHHFRYQRLLKSSATSKNAQFMTNSAKKALKMAVLLQAQALDLVHSLGSAASPAVEGQPSPLHHLIFEHINL